MKNYYRHDMAAKSKYFIAIAVAIGALAAILLLVSARERIGFGETTNMISEDHAKESIYKFLVKIGRDGGFALERVKQLLSSAEMDENPNVGKIWELESPMGSFSVSVKTGQVVEYSAAEPDVMGVERISEEEADRITEAFIIKVYPDYSNYKFVLIEKEKEHGYYEYTFKRKKEAGEVSIYPNVIAVSVRSDIAMVTDYACSTLNFVNYKQPKISEAQARKIVEKVILPHKGTIEEIELTEYPIKNSEESKTVWFATIVFKSGKFDYSDGLIVDANTGDILQSE